MSARPSPCTPELRSRLLVLLDTGSPPASRAAAVQSILDPPSVDLLSSVLATLSLQMLGPAPRATRLVLLVGPLSCTSSALTQHLGVLVHHKPPPRGGSRDFWNLLAPEAAAAQQVEEEPRVSVGSPPSCVAVLPDNGGGSVGALLPPTVDCAILLLRSSRANSAVPAAHSLAGQAGWTTWVLQVLAASGISITGLHLVLEHCSSFLHGMGSRRAWHQVTAAAHRAASPILIVADLSRITRRVGELDSLPCLAIARMGLNQAAQAGSRHMPSVVCPVVALAPAAAHSPLLQYSLLSSENQLYTAQYHLTQRQLRAAWWAAQQGLQHQTEQLLAACRLLTRLAVAVVSRAASLPGACRTWHAMCRVSDTDKGSLASQEAHLRALMPSPDASTQGMFEACAIVQHGPHHHTPVELVLKQAAPGDVICARSLDRLARSAEDFDRVAALAATQEVLLLVTLVDTHALQQARLAHTAPVEWATGIPASDTDPQLLRITAAWMAALASRPHCLHPCLPLPVLLHSPATLQWARGAVVQAFGFVGMGLGSPFSLPVPQPPARHCTRHTGSGG